MFKRSTRAFLHIPPHGPHAPHTHHTRHTHHTLHTLHTPPHTCASPFTVALVTLPTCILRLHLASQRAIDARDPPRRLPFTLPRNAAFSALHPTLANLHAPQRPVNALVSSGRHMSRHAVSHIDASRSLVQKLSRHSHTTLVLFFYQQPRRALAVQVPALQVPALLRQLLETVFRHHVFSSLRRPHLSQQCWKSLRLPATLYISDAGAPCAPSRACASVSACADTSACEPGRAEFPRPDKLAAAQRRHLTASLRRRLGAKRRRVARLRAALIVERAEMVRALVAVRARSSSVEREFLAARDEHLAAAAKHDRETSVVEAERAEMVRALVAIRARNSSVEREFLEARDEFLAAAARHEQATSGHRAELDRMKNAYTGTILDRNHALLDMQRHRDEAIQRAATAQRTARDAVKRADAAERQLLVLQERFQATVPITAHASSSVASPNSPCTAQKLDAACAEASVADEDQEGHSRSNRQSCVRSNRPDQTVDVANGTEAHVHRSQSQQRPAQTGPHTVRDNAIENASPMNNAELTTGPGRTAEAIGRGRRFAAVVGHTPAAPAPQVTSVSHDTSALHGSAGQTPVAPAVTGSGAATSATTGQPSRPRAVASSSTLGGLARQGTSARTAKSGSSFRDLVQQRSAQRASGVRRGPLRGT